MRCIVKSYLLNEKPFSLVLNCEYVYEIILS